MEDARTSFVMRTNCAFPLSRLETSLKKSRTGVHDLPYGIVHSQKVRQEREDCEGVESRHLYLYPYLYTRKREGL